MQDRATAYVWDPTTGTLAAAGSMGEARSTFTATLLPDGRMLIVGGPGQAELWEP